VVTETGRAGAVKGEAEDPGRPRPRTQLNVKTSRVGRLGLEPRTHGLKVRCSTIELTPREN
jgi:hypothetical protein